MAISIGRSLLTGLLTGVNQALRAGGSMKDYAHAAKTFRPNQFANAGRYKYLFHVFFNINANIDINLPDTTFSYLVKTVELPKFGVDIKEQNQYNKKRLVQTKIKYQPVSITFHDDNAGQVRELWRAYYNYYYGDGRYPTNSYQPETGTPYVYHTPPRGKWGYDPTQADNFFTSVEIHSFHAGQSQKITLIDPVIIGFNHDTHDYADGQGLMQHNMQINYTSVKYEQGYWTGAPGFGDGNNYDLVPSNLSGGFEGTVSDNLGNSFTPGDAFVDGFLTGTINSVASQAAQEQAYENRNNFRNRALNGPTIAATLTTPRQIGGGTNYIFPQVNVASSYAPVAPIPTAPATVVSERVILDDNRQYFGIYPSGSWQRALEDQGYDPRDIESTEPFITAASDAGEINNNSEALSLAINYINNTKDNNETVKTINNIIQNDIVSFSNQDPAYKADSWQQELKDKGYLDEDIKYASFKLSELVIRLDENESLTPIAEEIIKRKNNSSNNLY